MQGAGFRIQMAEVLVEDLECRVQRFGCSIVVMCLGFSVRILFNVQARVGNG